MPKEKGTEYKDLIKKATKGLFGTITDIGLFIVLFHLMPGRSTTRGVDMGDRIGNAIHLTKIINNNSIDRAIYRLKSKDYLERKKDYIKITDLGKERLTRILPVYERKRPWDGFLYLITYDIPEDKKRKRDYLREYIEKLGCGMLQQSVWLACYNPRKLIIDFVQKHRVGNLVLVSRLEGGIGGWDIGTVVKKVYKLDDLEKFYIDFVEKVDAGKLSGLKLFLDYLAILKKDPQLPFELLPHPWTGELANDYFEEELKKFKNLDLENFFIKEG